MRGFVGLRSWLWARCGRLYCYGAYGGASWCVGAGALVGGGLGQCFGMEQQKQSWLPGGVWGVTI